ncbi:MAG TPA: Eco57I restriction-modification methylase domain-containing protein, partial [Mariniphaga sp.]|nr:Eco57I restriction-modification methylase domain-containing protein [Mariniphaga sp.]
MKLNPVKPLKALNKAWLKTKPVRNQIEQFKNNLNQLFEHTNENESEEFHKNLLSNFLKSSYCYDNYLINTRYREDLAIYNGSNTTFTAGIIIETKKPTNKSEMLSCENINVKALHELILYYMRERITEKNLEIKHLIATNIYEWFIFDATEFEKHFVKNSNFLREFNKFEGKQLSGTDTDFFYKNIAARWIDEVKDEITFTHLDLRDIKKLLPVPNPANDAKLIPYYKIFSPEHLLKLPFENDSNSLDKGFYHELLHIIGLEETKEGNKKVIGRKAPKRRNQASLIENTINILNFENYISFVNRSNYGSKKEEQLFNIALELSIVWINRILFLKLLEGQLVKYHKGDKSYRFLNTKSISDYDDLNKLFFRILAIRAEDRLEADKIRFNHIPYLNSSLFETSEIERKTIRISNLEDNCLLPVLNSTILTDEKGKKVKGNKNTLHYLLEFLDAYDFSSEGSEEIQEERKTIINASVLGLFFEKINGYKDGSFFTPGFITMYMARQTVKRAVLQKFNDIKGWECKSIDELYNRINDKPEANRIINSLKICDPAVGSGHFLVSVLNEIISLKSNLKILTDRKGRILRDYHVEVENDELVVTDEEGWLFEYRLGNMEKQRIQETLFHEKQTIIENCLFGVDINPNSVKICRLRLWIELLKNAYYKEGTNELETLPNIDINIKTGNSLISRYAIDSDLKKALKISRHGIDGYKLAVNTYRNAANKEQKHAMLELIETIKNDFEIEIAANDKRRIKLNKYKGELFSLSNQKGLFEMSQAQKKIINKKAAGLAAEIKKLESELEEIANNKIYENAFEWRFEFPEVLNDDGDFTGFDIVIGNPPYIRQEEFTALKPAFQSKFKTYSGTADLYVYFIEQGLTILNRGGEFMFIVPNKWMRAGYGKQLRTKLKDTLINTILDFGDLPVFDEATTYPCILAISKDDPAEIFETAEIKTLEFPHGLEYYINQHKYEVLSGELQDEGWTLCDSRVQRLLAKLRTKGIPLGEYVNNGIYYGIKTGLNEAFVIDESTKERLITEDPASAEIIKPFLAGRDIKRYQTPGSNKYLILLKNGDTHKWFGNLSEENALAKLKEKYSAIVNHLLQFEEKAKKRYDKGQYWWELRACDYYDAFEKPKIMLPDISLRCQATFDCNENFYCVNTAYIIPGLSLSDLAILNSKLIHFFYSNLTPSIRGG